MIKTLTEVGMEQIPCANCGIIFALPTDYANALKENHKSFYCPNGHSLSWHDKNEAELLKEKLIAAQDHCNHLETELNGTLKRLACVEKRIHAGICPECHRHFLNVERHMKSKHSVKG